MKAKLFCSSVRPSYSGLLENSMMKETERADGRTDEKTICRIMTEILGLFQRESSNTTDGRILLSPEQVKSEEKV